jgi:hypothetical protein
MKKKNVICKKKERKKNYWAGLGLISGAIFHTRRVQTLVSQT